MNRTALRSGAFTAPAALEDTGWQIAAIADFNSDWKPDLFWRHGGSGQMAVWYMDRVTLTGGTLTSPPALTDLAWRVVGPR
jgi:hypothetical protein